MRTVFQIIGNIMYEVIDVLKFLVCIGISKNFCDYGSYGGSGRKQFINLDWDQIVKRFVSYFKQFEFYLIIYKNCRFKNLYGLGK